MITELLIEYFFVEQGQPLHSYETLIGRSFRALLIYGHQLIFILFTLLLYFKINQVRIARIRKLYDNRQQLLSYLSKLNKKLADYAFYHSHELRAPVSRALGINQLLAEDFQIKGTEERVLLQSLHQSILEIDQIIRKMNSELEELEIKIEQG